MKDMKMKNVNFEPIPVCFLKLAVTVLDNFGDSIGECLKGFRTSETQKFIRTFLTKGEFSDSKMIEFRSYLCDEYRIIEALKGTDYASKESGFADLLALSKARA
jgi:hypothetical protein